MFVFRTPQPQGLCPGCRQAVRDGPPPDSVPATAPPSLTPTANQPLPPPGSTDAPFGSNCHDPLSRGAIGRAGHFLDETLEPAWDGIMAAGMAALGTVVMYTLLPPALVGGGHLLL